MVLVGRAAAEVARALGLASRKVAAPRPKKSRHATARARGMAIERAAARVLEEMGARVEVAPATIRWIPVKPENRTPGGPERVPMTQHHDYFGVFDIVFALPSPTRGIDPRRGFAQVTNLSNTSHRRAKLVASRFPFTRDDLLLVHERGATFRVMRAPDFLDRGERWSWTPKGGLVIENEKTGL